MATTMEMEEGKQTYEITEREAKDKGKTKQEKVKYGFEEKQNKVRTIDTNTFILFKYSFLIQDQARSETWRAVSAVTRQRVSTKPRLGESWKRLHESYRFLYIT